MKPKQAPTPVIPLPFWETIEITEQLLQFIWQFQYFNRARLETTAGEPLEIVAPGRPNRDQGPDFSNARIRLGKTLLAGTVELHLKTSGWTAHGHSGDEHYRNVVLHVVYEHDGPEVAGLPVLELQHRISRLLLQQYRRWMEGGDFIPCASSIGHTPALTWLAWKDRLAAERLTRKAVAVLELVKASGGHWEEVAWWLLARSFGGSVNADAFEAVARSLPGRLLARHRGQIHQLEALLLGQCGLLRGPFKDEYPRLLYREYRFLRKKYSLQPILQPVHFLRMRPPNFPTIRLAQLAMYLHGQSRFFPSLLSDDVATVRAALTVTANDYWHYRYLPDEESPFRKKTLGREMVDGIIINTAAPLLFAYGSYQGNEALRQKAVDWLLATAAESNRITRAFADCGLRSTTAFDSQALLELKGRYCDERLCLKCAVGKKMLRNH